MLDVRGKQFDYLCPHGKVFTDAQLDFVGPVGGHSEKLGCAVAGPEGSKTNDQAWSGNLASFYRLSKAQFNVGPVAQGTHRGHASGQVTA